MDLKWDDLANPIPSQIETVDLITPVIRRGQCPIIALPIDPQPLLHTHCGFQAFCTASNNISITPIIPIDPLFPPWSMDPKDHIMWERTAWERREMNIIRVEDQDDNYYWITCKNGFFQSD